MRYFSGMDKKGGGSGGDPTRDEQVKGAARSFLKQKDDGKKSFWGELGQKMGGDNRHKFKRQGSGQGQGGTGRGPRPRGQGQRARAPPSSSSSPPSSSSFQSFPSSRPQEDASMVQDEYDNNRGKKKGFLSKKRNSRGKGFGAGSFGESSEGGGARGRGRKGGKGRGKGGEFRRGSAEGDNVSGVNFDSIRDPADNWALQAITMDDFVKATRAGQQLDTSDMDAMDSFVVDLIHGSMKTQDRSTSVMLDMEEARPAIVPPARSTAELMASLKPPKSMMAGAVPNSLPYQLAARTYHVVGGNYYYSDAERDQATRLALSMSAGTISDADSMEDDEVDRIFDPSFRKGRRQMERDELDLARALNPEQVFEAQDAPDWDQNAVVDEDDL